MDPLLQFLLALTISIGAAGLMWQVRGPATGGIDLGAFG